MAMSFSDLKKSRNSEFEKLQKAAEELKSNKPAGDDRFWSPTVDSSGNGFAVIRFLPAPKEEDVAFIRLFSHGFKGPTGQWYIENSLTTLGQKDPVSELNSALWNESEDDNSPQRKQARAQKRRLTFISNIYVVRDPGNPANEGKVFLYKYGKKIWDKINGAMYPEFEDEEGFNPFDFWTGANFKLKIRNVEGYRNYDKSEFDKPEALSSNDEALSEIWDQEHSLQALIAPDQFKSYDELSAKLKTVLGEQAMTPNQRLASAPIASYTPPAATKAAKAPEAPSASDDDLPWSTEGGSDEEDPMKLFEMMSK